MTLRCLLLSIAFIPFAWGAAPETVGPWRLELVAEAPAVRHPSVVCAAADGRIFVAEDPMDISAPANARQGRVICFHPDGRRTVFAENLHAVFGMQYLEGKLYVLHNPLFTVFEDGGEKAGKAENIIESTNPNPWALDWNDHVPANFKLAMDGYFYMAVGDKGIFGAVGRDGRKVFLHGGGILRLRPDGTGMEVYSTGVRNILDVALTSEDEIFTYDNTDEHDWMGRLTHMVEGGFYGYPHDFIPRRPYTLWMMHDFGGGAATGTFAYTEDALPAEFHDNLFLADFGKRQILRVIIEREGATFKVARHEEMFKNMPDDFRPVGIAPSADGKSILICDWQHRDTKAEVEVGRLWRLSYTGETREKGKPGWFVPVALGKKAQVSDAVLGEGLEHPAKSVRMAAQRELERRGGTNVFKRIYREKTGPAQWHAAWGLNMIGDKGASRENTHNPLPSEGRGKGEALARGATAKPDAQIASPLGGERVRVRGILEPRDTSFVAADSTILRQAIRAGLVEANEFLSFNDASVRFQAATAFGRNGGSSDALIERMNDEDAFARYAAMNALNRIGRTDTAAWPGIVAAMVTRTNLAFALRETWNLELYRSLVSFLRDKNSPIRARIKALNLVAAMARKFPEWKGEWWAYHPALAARPKKTVAWEGTEGALAVVREMTESPEKDLRLAAVWAVGENEEQSLAGSLRDRFEAERDLEVRAAILQTFERLRYEHTGALIARVLRGDVSELMIDAVRAAQFGNGSAMKSALVDLLGREISPDVRAETIRTLGILEEQSATKVIARNVESREAKVRMAAIRAMGKLGGNIAVEALRGVLKSGDAETKRGAIAALGEIKDSSTVPELLAAWRESETREPALEALLRMPDLRAMEVYEDALGSANPAIRERARKALEPLGKNAWVYFKDRVPSMRPIVVAELQKFYPEMRDLTLVSTRSVVPTTDDYVKYALGNKGDVARGKKVFFDETGVACVKCHTVGEQGNAVGPDMTSIGAQFPRNALIEHIVTPSKSVREGYQQVRIETDDDELVAGLVKAESGEDVTVLDGQARLHTIPKRKITKRHQSELSLMPEGLHVGLTVEEFSDLVAYLESLKGEGK